MLQTDAALASAARPAAAPGRVQLSRSRGYRKPAGAVVVARPSKWGNPFVVGSMVSLSGVQADGLHFDGIRITMTPAMAAAAYRYEMVGRLTTLDSDPEEVAYAAGWRAALAELAGKDLACWCPLAAPGEPDYCHAAVLLDLANRPGPHTPRKVGTR